MKKRIFSVFTMIAMLVSLIPAMPAGAAASINIGEYIEMGTYYGEPILWRCVDIDENGPLMLSDKIICLKPFDAAGDNESGSHGRSGSYRKSYGSNYWADSNMRSWLNSSASAGNVSWLCGNPPDNDHVWSGYNDYADEAGFKTNFTSGELGAVKTVTQDSLLNYNEYSDMSQYGSAYHTYNSNISSVVQNAKTSAYRERVTDEFFLLDVNQINAVYNNSSILGSSYYIGEPTAQAVANSEYKTSSLKSGNKWYFWLRSPYAFYFYGSNVRFVSSGGHVSDGNAYYGYYGVRPAFYLNLPSSSFVSGSGTAESPYRVSGNGSLVEEATANQSNNEPSSWAEDEVNQAFDYGLVPDELQSEYREPITRYEFCVLVERLIKKFTDDRYIDGYIALNMRSDLFFPDTTDSSVHTVMRLGIIGGYDDGTFKPDNMITREEAAIMLYRTKDVISASWGWSLYGDGIFFFDNVKNLFEDGWAISDWAIDGVEYVYSRKDPNNDAPIMGGVGNNRFDPQGTYTREQALISFKRFYSFMLNYQTSMIHRNDQNDYYDEKRKKSAEEKANSEIMLAIDELDSAIAEYKVTIQEKTESIGEKDISAVARIYDIMALDRNSKKKFESVKNYINQAMYDYTVMVQSSVKDISKLTDMNKLTKALLSNMVNNKETYSYGGYTIEIIPYGRYGDASAGTIICSNGSKEYKYSFNSSLESTQSAVAELLRQSAELSKELGDKVIEAVITDITEAVDVPRVGDFLTQKLTSQTNKILQKIGFGDINKTLGSWYKLYKRIDALHDVTDTDAINSADDINKFINEFDSCMNSDGTDTISEALVKKAADKVKEKMENLKDVLTNNLYNVN